MQWNESWNKLPDTEFGRGRRCLGYCIERDRIMWIYIEELNCPVYEKLYEKNEINDVKSRDEK